MEILASTRTWDVEGVKYYFVNFFLPLLCLFKSQFHKAFDIILIKNAIFSRMLSNFTFV